MLVKAKLVERREQLLLCEIARGTEDHHREWHGHERFVLGEIGRFLAAAP